MSHLKIISSVAIALFEFAMGQGPHNWVQCTVTIRFCINHIWRRHWKWFTLAHKHRSHLTNSLFIARLSSIGETENIVSWMLSFTMSFNMPYIQKMNTRVQIRHTPLLIAVTKGTPYAINRIFLNVFIEFFLVWAVALSSWKRHTLCHIQQVIR